MSNIKTSVKCIDSHNDRFRILFESSSDAHFIFSSGQITDCNQATVDLLRAKNKSDVLKIHPAQLSPPVQPDGLLSIEKSKQMDALAKKNGVHKFEWVHRALDGHDFPVQVTLNAVQINGQDAMIAVWHDLTQLKEKEKELWLANQKMKKDLEAAAAIQKALLPVSSPLVKGLKSAWVYEPCEELGGDILNIFPIDQKHAGLYVLDVAGHGLASSYLSVAASHFLSPFSETSFIRKQDLGGNNSMVARPYQVAEKLNRHFGSNPDFFQFFTLLYGVLNVETFEFCYICAGHPQPILIPAKAEARLVAGSGMPIGISQDFEYSEMCLILNPGDRLYLYSDGLTEARNKKGEMFGPDRLMETLHKYRKKPIAESASKTVLSLKKWCRWTPFKDDITLLATELSAR